jgi:hypothetical protein
VIVGRGSVTKYMPICVAIAGRKTNKALRLETGTGLFLSGEWLPMSTDFLVSRGQKGPSMRKARLRVPQVMAFVRMFRLLRTISYRPYALKCLGNQGR